MNLSYLLKQVLLIFLSLFSEIKYIWGRSPGGATSLLQSLYTKAFEYWSLKRSDTRSLHNFTREWGFQGPRSRFASATASLLRVSKTLTWGWSSRSLEGCKACD
jgi:hypothetical protein